MENNSQSPQFLRKRKFFLVMPVLALPFLTLIFWSLGGGAQSIEKKKEVTMRGININLPDAHLEEDKSFDKLSYYDKAAMDSAKYRELLKNDPYYKLNQFENLAALSTDTSPLISSSNNYLPPLQQQLPHGSSIYRDPNEARVYDKLNQLNRAIEKSEDQQELPGQTSLTKSPAAVNSSDLDRLEQMMQTVTQGGESDPELNKLNGMLEKILDIQHPDRFQDRLRETSEIKKGQVYPVSTQKRSSPVSLLTADNDTTKDKRENMKHSSNGFFSLDESLVTEEQANAIKAVIHEDQTLVNGSTVKLRLSTDVYINGQLIPKDQFVYGEAVLDGERLTIRVNSVRYNNSLFPVQLSVYDLDGLSGIHIPGAITRDVAKQSVDRAVQGLGFTALDPSIGAQAASAGIEMARNLVGKKVRLIKVTVKAGYQVLIKDDKQNQP